MDLVHRGCKLASFDFVVNVMKGFVTVTTKL